MVLFDGEFTSSSSSSPSTPSSCLISAEEIIDAFKDSSDDIFMKFARDAVIGKNIVDAAAAVGATASKGKNQIIYDHKSSPTHTSLFPSLYL